MKTNNLVNVAPSSAEGHFVKGNVEVVNLDEINEIYLVKGESVLVTKNHTSLALEDECLITCQTVFNPYSKLYEKSKD